MRIFVLGLCMLMPFFGYTQFAISFHQSSLPFAGFSYQINRMRPELRLGTDARGNDISLEGVLTYDLIKHEEYEFYAGLGVRTEEGFTTLVVPVGINIYPLPVKRFGFHIELAPIIDDGLRGSWGIRYRFGTTNNTQKK